MHRCGAAVELQPVDGALARARTTPRAGDALATWLPDRERDACVASVAAARDDGAAPRTRGYTGRRRTGLARGSRRSDTAVTCLPVVPPGATSSSPLCPPHAKQHRDVLRRRARRRRPLRADLPLRAV